MRRRDRVGCGYVASRATAFRRSLRLEPLEDRRLLAAVVDLFVDLECTTRGLVGSYVNQCLRDYAPQDDWRQTQAISGTRVDETIDFQDASWGSRTELGLTVGSDSDWDNFSVQWDGFLRIQLPVGLMTRSDDGSRMWIDIDHNGTFGAAPPEFVDNHWGSGQAATVGPTSPLLQPGVYPVRLQYEEGGGGNIMQLLTAEPATVHIAYVVPSNRTPQPDAVERLQYSVEMMQSWYRDQMERNGFGPKTFFYETEADGRTPVIHVVNVAETDAYLREDAWSRVAEAASNAGIPVWSSGQVWLLVPEMHIQNADGSVTGGVALGGSWGSGMDGGVALIGSNGLAVMGRDRLFDDMPYDDQILPAVGPYPLVQDVSFAWFEGTTLSSLCSTYLGAALHEMSHGFGMPHDFRNDSNFDGNVMGNGLRGMRGALLPYRYAEDDMWLSYGQAMALANSPYFNQDRLMPETQQPTVSILTAGKVDPVNGLLRVEFTASDDTELAAAFITRAGDQVGELTLSGMSTTAVFETPYYTAGESSEFSIFVYDVYGNRGTATAPITPATGFNSAPKPFVDFSRTCTIVGTAITLDASRSSDPNHATSSLLVEWDINGDGVFDTAPTTQKQTTISFATPGTRLIQARLTDPAGAQAVSVPIGVRVVLPADSNFDNRIDQTDAKILAAHWGMSGMTWADGDFNNDGMVNAIDAAILAANWTPTIVVPLLPGDANGDRVVNEADAKILASNWGKTGMTWAQGDFNNDGLVNAIDAAILAAHFGMTLPPPGEATPVEPVVDASPFVGPLPAGGVSSARQPIQAVQRLGGRPGENGTQQRELLGTEQRAYTLRSPDVCSPELLVESSAAASDAALAEEYGPAIEPAGLLNRHAGWSRMVARRQANRRDAGELDPAGLAVDLLLADR
ncbi:MAG: hypothetical protein GX621_00120 [Pirellulaceae bacterium]|nr:hypothetical protein [Pirellulaceae bacterium]